MQVRKGIKQDVELVHVVARGVAAEQRGDVAADFLQVARDDGDSLSIDGQRRRGQEVFGAFCRSDSLDAGQQLPGDGGGELVELGAGVLGNVEPCLAVDHDEHAQVQKARDGHVHFVDADVEHAGNPATIGTEGVEANQLEDGKVMPLGDDLHGFVLQLPYVPYPGVVAACPLF